MLYQYLQPAVAESVWSSHYRMMLLQHDPAERHKLGFIHSLPEMCWDCFSEADPVDWRLAFAVVHFNLSSVAVWDALLVLYTAGYILCSLSVADWGETVTAKQPDCYTLLCTVYFVRDINLDISHFQLNTTRESHGWAAEHTASSLMTKCHLGVVSSLSAMVLLFRLTPCCILLI